MKKSKNKEIIIFQAKSGPQLQISLKKGNIWLTQAQIALLFNIERSVVTKHLGNIFKEKELNIKSVCAFFAHTASDKKTYKTQHYNLDAVISVGYRVNSKQATLFRIWATKVLKKHLLDGYTINEKRLKQNREIKFKEMEKAVGLLQRVINAKQLNTIESQGLLKVIADYTQTWLLLQKYDKGKLGLPKTVKKVSAKLDYQESQNAICQLKLDLLSKKDAGDLFGQEVGGSFEGIIGGLYQVFGSKELYNGLEEKAAHLLYFIIKDHPFTDGNKRIGSFLFILFLAKNNYLLNKKGERKINDNALVALAILVAESDPKEKDVLVALITNLLVK